MTSLAPNVRDQDPGSSSIIQVANVEFRILCILNSTNAIISLVQEIFQHVRPPNFECFQSFFSFLKFDIVHQEKFKKYNDLQIIFLI